MDDAETSSIESFLEHKQTLSYNEPPRDASTAQNYMTDKVINISRCGRLLPDSTLDLFDRLIPDLFPFGTGLPDSDRDVTVSTEQCVPHYLQLSSRRFFNHSFFTLIAFDLISKKNAIMRCAQ